MLKKISASVFCAILYLFSSAVLIFSLLVSIKLTSVNDRAVELERQIHALRLENDELSLKYESLISPEELEAYAVEKLGMQPQSSEQTVYLFIEELND